MTKEELKTDYYINRPIEPYSDDDFPTDWANIAHYAEENLEKAFKHIAEFEKETTEFKEQIEKMKCCGNCKHRDDMTSYCEKHKKEIYIFMVDCRCNDWELY